MSGNRFKKERRQMKAILVCLGHRPFIVGHVIQCYTCSFRRRVKPAALKETVPLCGIQG